MTREILFRGKAHSTGEWIFGDLDTCGGCPEIWDHSRGVSAGVRDSTIGQYTGLKDKNGRKIFEGDILMDHIDPEHPEAETHALIEWRGFGWVLVEKGEFFDTVVEADDRTWTVIGNIWDNPELVKEEEHE